VSNKQAACIKATGAIGIKLLNGYLVDSISEMQRLSDWEAYRRYARKNEMRGAARERL